MKRSCLFMSAMMLALCASAQMPEWRIQEVYSVNAQTQRTELLESTDYDYGNGLPARVQGYKTASREFNVKASASETADGARLDLIYTLVTGLSSMH